MKRAYLSQNPNMYEQNHAGSIRPLKSNFVRMKNLNHGHKKSNHSIRSKIIFATYLVALTFLTSTAYGQASFGINIGGGATEFVYKDISKLMIGQRAGSGFVESQFDANGYPKYLNAGQNVTLAYGSGTNQLWPTGDYNIFFDGQGTIAELTGSATLKQDLGNGHQIWTVIHGGSDFIKFAITSTNSSNYLKNLRIIMPGFENDYMTDPIHPSFRSHWNMFSTFRFMDWMGTNGSPIVNFTNVMPATYIGAGYSGDWGDATFPSDPYGGSPELAADLCNRMNKDMWICMPHKASDACIQQIASLIKNKLNTNLKVYIEYSNECWNWAAAFSQTPYCQDQGISLGLCTSGSMQYYVYRCGQMYKLWEDIWGADKTRVINVFAWQTTNSNPEYWINLAINTWFYSSQFNPAGTHPEFYADAPYIWDQSSTTPASVNDLFAGSTEDLNFDKTIMSSQKSYANANGLQYGCYEAGQHYSSYATNEALDNSVYIPANRDSRMGTLYTDYMNYWKSNVGGLMMLFTTCGPFSKYGSWGLIERYNQDLSTAYKYQAAVNVINSTGGSIPVTGVTVSPTTASVAVGASTNLTATVAPSNATNKTLSWSSSNTSVATVNSSGVVTGVAAGSATITVTTADGNKTATCALTVTTAGSSTVYEAESGTYGGGSGIQSASNASNGQVVGGMNNTGSYSQISNINGGSGGAATLVIRYANGYSDNRSLSLYVNGTFVSQITFATTGGWNTFADKTGISINLNSGTANTIKLQKDAADVAAADIDKYTVTIGSSNVPVTGVTVSPTTATIAVGATTTLTATVAPSNATNKTVSWSTSNSAIATVNASGVVTGVAAGTATITVTTQDGNKTASAAITVTPVTPTTTKYEAESASLSGGAGVWSDHTGYSGTGFVGFTSQGSTVAFTVNASQAGSCTVVVTFAGGGGSKTMSLYLNGTKVKQITMVTTGWNTWVTETETLSLISGNNTIAYKWDSGDTGGVNIDFITVTGYGTLKSAAFQENISENDTEPRVKFYPNPVEGGNDITISGLNPGSSATIQIFDMSGKVLISKSIFNVSNTYQLSTIGLSNGLYLLQIRSKESVIIQKLLVK
jgi:uncharacterized protein YjdB